MNVFVHAISQKLTLKPFLQASASCYAERCTSYDRFCLSVCLSVCMSVTVRCHAKMTQATIMRSSLEDSAMTPVSSCLTTPQNSKGNIWSGGAERERQFLANKLPYLRNSTR